MFAENWIYAKQGVQIDKGLLSRPFYLKQLLARDGLAGIKEDKHAAYCALPLTSTPEELKPELKRRQSILMNILSEAGLSWQCSILTRSRSTIWS